MKLLAIDTSTEACSAALYIDGDVTSRYEYAPRQHTKLILPMIADLMDEAGLKPAQLDGLAFGRGPGAFTGIRIATGIIQGICFAVDLPVAEISSLAALAQGSYRKNQSKKVMAAIDARMNEIYWCCYQSDQGVMIPCMEEAVCRAEDARDPALEQDKVWQGTGSGWKSDADILVTRFSEQLSGIEPDNFPEAVDIVQLALPKFDRGEVVSADQVSPIYLRDQVVS